MENHLSRSFNQVTPWILDQEMSKTSHRSVGGGYLINVPEDLVAVWSFRVIAQKFCVAAQILVFRLLFIEKPVVSGARIRSATGFGIAVKIMKEGTTRVFHQCILIGNLIP